MIVNILSHTNYETVMLERSEASQGGGIRFKY